MPTRLANADLGFDPIDCDFKPADGGNLGAVCSGSAGGAPVVEEIEFGNDASIVRSLDVSIPGGDAARRAGSAA